MKTTKGSTPSAENSVSLASADMTAQDDTRLSTIRRLYFYTIALISLIAGISAVGGLLNALVDTWLQGLQSQTVLREVQTGSLIRNAIAQNGGLLVVATPLFLLHWRYIRTHMTEPWEKRATLRKVFLYIALATGLFLIVTNGIPLVRGIAEVSSGQALADSGIWPSRWLFLILMIGLGVGTARYFDTVVQADGDYGAEINRVGTVRRLFQTILGLIGLALLIFGAGGLIETLWRLVLPLDRLGTGNNWWSEPFANAVSMLIFGILIWRGNWQRWNRITAANPNEGQSALRRFYLYTGVVGSAVAALLPGAFLLKEFLLILFGAGGGDLADLLAKLTMPLAYIPVGVVAWRWHWRTVSAEADRFDDEQGETPASATIRRLYYYLVAATGLLLVWFGLVELVQMVLDALGTAGQTTSSGGPIWVEPLANGLSLLAVGAPIWAVHWRTVQSAARQKSAAGLAERASLPRRIYLYGVALVGALTILFFLASVIYRLFLLLLGDPSANLFSTETAGDVARSAISAILWAVHFIALRQDNHLGVDAPQPVAPSAQATRSELERRITALETELDTLRGQLAQLE